MMAASGRWAALPVLFLLLLAPQAARALYEDQAGTFDWSSLVKRT